MALRTEAQRMDRALVFHLLRCCEDVSARKVFMDRTHAALRSAVSGSAALELKQIFSIARRSLPPASHIHQQRRPNGLLAKHIAAAQAALNNLPQLHRQALADILNANQTRQLHIRHSLPEPVLQTAAQQALAAIHLQLLGLTLEDSPTGIVTRTLHAGLWWQRARNSTPADLEPLMHWLLASPANLRDLLFSFLCELLAGCVCMGL